ncbi:MAG: DUF423 domain-containing protein [Flavobacteriaceae bacterium]
MELKNRMIFFGSLWMLLSILLGAMASHFLERFLEVPSVESFQIGVQYLTYQGLGLLFLAGVNYRDQKAKKKIFYCLVLGSVLFSGSIFILSFQSLLPFSVSWLGPMTPLGGVLLILGWFYNVIVFFKKDSN